MQEQRQLTVRARFPSAMARWYPVRTFLLCSTILVRCCSEAPTADVTSNNRVQKLWWHSGPSSYLLASFHDARPALQTGSNSKRINKFDEVLSKELQGQHRPVADSADTETGGQLKADAASDEPSEPDTPLATNGATFELEQAQGEERVPVRGRNMFDAEDDDPQDDGIFGEPKSRNRKKKSKHGPDLKTQEDTYDNSRDRPAHHSKPSRRHRKRKSVTSAAADNAAVDEPFLPTAGQTAIQSSQTDTRLLPDSDEEALRDLDAWDTDKSQDHTAINKQAPNKEGSLVFVPNEEAPNKKDGLHLRQPAGKVKYDREGIPKNFHWEDYLKMYPELQEHGIKDEETARLHYRTAGKGEGRLHRVPPLYLQYTACTPVIEQLYSHLSAIVLGGQLAAEIILPPALTKDAEGRWAPVALRSILNVKQFKKNALAKRHVLHELSKRQHALFPMGVLWHGSSDDPHKDDEAYDPDTCYPRWKWVSTPDKYVLQVGDMYHRVRDVAQVADEIFRRIGQQAVHEFREGTRLDYEYEIIINLPCTFYGIHSFSALGPMQEAAEMLAWPVPLTELANKVVFLIKQMVGVPAFNGIVVMGHDDWRTWVSPLFPTVYYKYERGMKAVFNSSLPCYFGIEDLVDITQKDMQALEETVTKFSGCCSMVLTKQQVLEDHELRGLHAEQYKLLDFLVLVEAEKVIGNYKSYMALFLNEYRHLMYKGERELVRVQTKIEVGKTDLEIDKLAQGGLFTARHAEKIQDMPKLFLGGNEMKLQKIIEKQRAAKAARDQAGM